ncbi:TPA: hypothetical protein ACS737_001474 [Providencia alcalifaciens]
MVTGDTLSFGSTYFHTKARNYIAMNSQYKRKIGPDLYYVWFPETIYYINVPSATITGFDSFVHYQSQWFDLSFNHNLTTAKEDLENHALSSIRPESLIIKFNAPVSNTGINVGWSGEFAARTKITGDSTHKLPDRKNSKDLDRYRREIFQQAGYGIHDFYINYQADQFVKGLNTTLTLKNAFDKEYVSSIGVPQEGRNVYWNVNYRW